MVVVLVANKFVQLYKYVLNLSEFFSFGPCVVLSMKLCRKNCFCIKGLTVRWNLLHRGHFQTLMDMNGRSGLLTLVFAIDSEMTLIVTMHANILCSFKKGC